MNTLTKLALGLMGHNTPRPPAGTPLQARSLPSPRREGGLPLMEALARRQSSREFAPTALDEQTLSDLIWAAGGVNRPALGGRTAPSAMNAQEVLLYASGVQALVRLVASGMLCFSFSPRPPKTRTSPRSTSTS